MIGPAEAVPLLQSLASVGFSVTCKVLLCNKGLASVGFSSPAKSCCVAKLGEVAGAKARG
jgi:hypothetical protein